MFFKFFLYISCMRSPHLHAEIHTSEKIKLLNLNETSLYFLTKSELKSSSIA